MVLLVAELILLPDGNKIYDFSNNSELLVEDIHIQRIYDHFEYEDNWIILDLGAHVGIFSLYVSKKAMHGKIYAIEPFPCNYCALKANISLNSLVNIITINAAVSNRTGWQSLFVYPRTESCSLLKRLDKQIVDVVKVKTFTYDDLLSEYGIKKVDLVKVDIEGSERELLEGMKMLPTRIAMAHYHSKYARCATKEELGQMLEEKGYRITGLNQHTFFARLRGS